MRAAIYARVSSLVQRERHTIENQLRVLTEYVRQQGWTLADTYLDDGRSAKAGKLDERDGFARLLRDAELRRFDLLVVVDVDRLTRTDSIEERAMILGPFQRLGIDIVTPSGGRLDLRSMFGELWVTIQALGAAEENRKRAERIKAGKMRAIAEGRKPAGPTPYGLSYGRVSGAWSVHPQHGPIAREIIERITNGESCARITDDLSLRGAPGPRRDGAWSRDTVHRIATSRHLFGEWVADKHRGGVIKVPPIVTREEWDAAQEALGKLQTRGLVKARYVYMLQGLAKCGHCGEPICVRSGVSYYNAARELRRHPSAYVCRGRQLKRACTAKIVKTEELDERVWEKLMDELSQPDLIDALANIEAARAGDANDWAADAEKYRAHLARLEAVEAAFMTKYRRALISEGALDRELEGLARERKMVRDQLATAERAIGSTLSAQQRLRAAKATVEQLLRIRALATPEQRHALIRELTHDGGVVISDGRARLDLQLLRLEEAESRDGAVAASLSIAAVRSPD